MKTKFYWSKSMDNENRGKVEYYGPVTRNDYLAFKYKNLKDGVREDNKTKHMNEIYQMQGKERYHKVSIH